MPQPSEFGGDSIRERDSFRLASTSPNKNHLTAEEQKEEIARRREKNENNTRLNDFKKSFSR